MPELRPPRAFFRPALLPASRPLFLLCLLALALPAAEEWDMRWRVYCDAVTGITFRYPYDYYTRDQYKGELYRRKRLEDSAEESEVKVIEVDGKQVRVRFSGDDAPRARADVQAFSVSAAELAELKAGPDLAAIGDALTKQKLAWKPFEYYAESPKRPFASRKWAAKEITAMIGEGASACAIVVKHGDRHSALLLTGKLAAAENQAIIDTFEVLQPGKGKNPPLDWREAQGRAGKAFDAAGLPVASAGKGAVPWAQGWDVESAHFHITSHVSPARLVQHAQYLEALYKGYTGIYEPDALPPYKFEIHVFNTHPDFMAAAAAHGFPVPETVGGFFLPQQQAIFVYEDSIKWGGDDFSVEHVLAHECSHQFLHMACNGSRNVPTWLNEGLAVYFEAGVIQGGQFVERTPKGRIENLKQIYDRTKTTIMPVDQYLGHYGHILPSQYGEVYAMTYFWLFGTCEAGCKHKDGECGRAHFRDYWQRLKAGEDGTKAFDATFMDGLIKAKGSREAAITAWQNAYFTYVKRVMR
jgi:hypothetical protein